MSERRWKPGGALRFTLTLRSREMQAKASGSVTFATIEDFDREMVALTAELRDHAETLLPAAVLGVPRPKEDT